MRLLIYRERTWKRRESVELQIARTRYSLQAYHEAIATNGRPEEATRHHGVDASFGREMFDYDVELWYEIQEDIISRGKEEMVTIHRLLDLTSHIVQ